jgi:glycosyltransferase involved in cell wall biosynthesis
MTIAAVVITKDEERNIEDCLGTLAWADERIVVDAESRDRTVELARRHTDRIWVRPWPGYGPQKNFAMEQTQAEWVLIVDADERVTPELREEIRRVLLAGPSSDVGGYEIPRRNYFYGKWIRGGGLHPDHQLRLLRRAAGRYDETLLHERLRLAGRVERLRQPMDHHSMPTVKDHVRKMRRYTTLAAQEKLKTRDRVTAPDLLGSHLATIARTWLFRGGWRDGVHGVVVALFAGMHTFVKYAKAWEMIRKREQPG